MFESERHRVLQRSSVRGMASAELEGNADAVEFCPTPPFFDVLAAATYTLHEAGEGQGCPSRLGTLSLFHVLPSGHGDLQLRQIHLLQTCGIFDIKWMPSSSHPSLPVLAQAGADGTLSLYNLQVQDLPYLQERTKDSISSFMCLSLDWNPHTKQHISLSHSGGGLCVIDIRESHVEVSHYTNDAHSFEAWCATYDSWRPSILYSGGDDCHFCCWDLRQSLFKPVFREKKTHQMGVTSIQNNPHQENILATGSYDEKLRIWDTRMEEKPFAEKVLELGGGVWKLKWNPHDKAFLAAACMHNGFMIVKIQGDEALVAMEYKKHKSLAYGIDWFKGPLTSDVTEPMQEEKHLTSILGERKDLVRNFSWSTPAATADRVPSERQLSWSSSKKLSALLASCSFYDRSLHAWKTEFPS